MISTVTVTKAIVAMAIIMVTTTIRSKIMVMVGGVLLNVMTGHQTHLRGKKVTGYQER